MLPRYRHISYIIGRSGQYNWEGEQPDQFEVDLRAKVGNMGRDLSEVSDSGLVGLAAFADGDRNTLGGGDWGGSREEGEGGKDESGAEEHL